MWIFGGFLSYGLKNVLKLICLCSLTCVECHGSVLVISRDLLWFLADLWPDCLKCLNCGFPVDSGVLGLGLRHLWYICVARAETLICMCCVFGLTRIWYGFGVFMETDLSFRFSAFSRIACLRMPYRGYGCIPCFISEISVYGMLVFEFVSGDWGFKSVL